MTTINSYDVQTHILTELNTVISPNLIILANQKAPKPTYPYATLNVLMAYSDPYQYDDIDKSYDSVNNNIIVTKNVQAEMTISIQAYSTNQEQAYDLAQQIKDWFDFKSDSFAFARKLDIIESEDIEKVDTLLIDTYEHRYFFDVRIRYSHDITRTVTTIETVEVERSEN